MWRLTNSGLSCTSVKAPVRKLNASPLLLGELLSFIVMTVTLLERFPWWNVPNGFNCDRNLIVLSQVRFYVDQALVDPWATKRNAA